MCQVFQVARENLQNIMDGYCIGEPHFSQRLEENVNTLIKALRDPALPLLELQVRYRLIIAGFMKKGYVQDTFDWQTYLYPCYFLAGNDLIHFRAYSSKR